MLVNTNNLKVVSLYEATTSRFIHNPKLDLKYSWKDTCPYSISLQIVFSQHFFYIEKKIIIYTIKENTI